MSNFTEDNKWGKIAENLVADYLQKVLPQSIITQVGEVREYYHKGDIIVEQPDGETAMVEVKNDKCVGRTHNILCEESVFYDYLGDYVQGNMYYDYQYYVVVSLDTRKMYFLDFQKLKKVYKKGILTEIPHYDQKTICFLCSLGLLRKNDVIIAELEVPDYDAQTGRLS